MQMSKKDIYQFLTWMRNGIAFCTTWFLILLLVYNLIFKIQSISTSGLIKLVLFCTGGVFLFNVCFTRLLIKKWSFLKRLTCFMTMFCIYQCWGFYQLNIFKGRGTVISWMFFLGIVFGLYLCCITIYHSYSKKQG